MRGTDRSNGLRSSSHQIIIESPSQILQISSSYGSLVGQNIRVGPNRICISQGGQQISLSGGAGQVAEYSYSLSSSCDFDINVRLGIAESDESAEEVSFESGDQELASDTEDPSEEWSQLHNGLTQSEIDELPLFRYKQLCRQRDRDNCSICLAELECNHFVRVLPCLHLFHQQCIDKWLNKTSLCPLCKSQI